MAVEQAPPKLSNVERLRQEALDLNREDREDLLASLQESLDPSDSEAVSEDVWQASWAAEIDRRLDNYRAGRTKLHSHEDVMSMLRARLRQP